MHREYRWGFELFNLLLLAENVAESLPQNLGGLESSVDFTWMFVKVILVLAFVCLIAFAVIKYILPKASFIKQGHDSQIELVERFALEPRKSLYILKVGSRFLLLGTSENTLSPLMELSRKDLSRETSQEN